MFLRQASLDETLAGGADPSNSPELSMRARQLTSERHRRALAASLEAAVESAERHGPTRTARPPLARREVRAARGALLRLAGELRAGGHVHPAGMARAHILLTDGVSPLYLYGQPARLRQAVRDAEVALRAGHST